MSKVHHTHIVNPSSKQYSNLTATILPTTTLTPLKVSQFINHPTNNISGNVGVAISGGGSRSMVAAMGQLRGLKALSNAQGNLLEQTKAISTVSGGSWLGIPFMYLNSACRDDDLLGIFQEPGTYTTENLQQLNECNIGSRCIVKFSAKDLALESVMLIIGGLPPDMVWQTLIGIHILKFYDLYSQAAGLPNNFFSYDKQSLENILHSNPSLANKTCYLVTAEKTKVTRPFFICNTAMFVNVPNKLNKFLVPVQITPFFTGIFSNPEDARDANHQLVGGGGVTSFAFNSNLQAIDQKNATVTQSRQFSLTDAAGASSSFFAEYLEKMAIIWNGNLKHFFDDVKDKLNSDRWQHILKNIPIQHGKIIFNLLNKLDALSHQETEIANEQLLKADIDPKIFHDALGKMIAILPKYHYWSVNNTDPQADVLDNVFADGGNLENTGISALLLYEDIDNIISFINSATPLASAEYGIIDYLGQEIPGTRIIVDDQIPPLFGYQPYQDKLGYKLYSTDSHPKGSLMQNNQIFSSQAFAELLQGLWQVSGNENNPGSNQSAANYLQNLVTVENTWFGIKAGKQIKVLWIYNNFINDWYEQLSASVRQAIFNNDPSNYYHFPHYSTLDTQLTPTQINLLAAQTSWSVVKGSPDKIFSLYQYSQKTTQKNDLYQKDIQYSGQQS